MKSSQTLNSTLDGVQDDALPWPMEELTLPETWWLVLMPTVNVSQVGGITWNKVPTRQG
jgi:hypothetical protein